MKKNYDSGKNPNYNKTNQLVCLFSNDMKPTACQPVIFVQKKTGRPHAETRNICFPDSKKIDNITDLLVDCRNIFMY